MSEETKKVSRSVAEIQGEYQALCTRAGHIQYQVFTLSKDLDMLNESMRNLNFEASEASKAEAAPKADEGKSNE